jgi:hypothetical protein
MGLFYGQALLSCVSVFYLHTGTLLVSRPSQITISSLKLTFPGPCSKNIFLIEEEERE